MTTFFVTEDTINNYVIEDNSAFYIEEFDALSITNITDELLLPINCVIADQQKYEMGGMHIESEPINAVYSGKSTMTATPSIVNESWFSRD